MDLFTTIFSRDQRKRTAAKLNVFKSSSLTIIKTTPDILWTTKLSLITASTGLASGSYLAGVQRSSQFLAENAHRLPKTNHGWYYYHKIKHSEVIHAACKGGLLYSLKFALVGLSFGTSEHFIRYYRRNFNTLYNQETNCIALEGFGAGVLSAISFSMMNRMAWPYAKYALLVGSTSGFVIGGLQDLYGLMYGCSLKDQNQKRKSFSDFNFKMSNLF